MPELIKNVLRENVSYLKHGTQEQQSFQVPTWPVHAEVFPKLLKSTSESQFSHGMNLESVKYTVCTFQGVKHKSELWTPQINKLYIHMPFWTCGVIVKNTGLSARLGLGRLEFKSPPAMKWPWAGHGLSQSWRIMYSALSSLEKRWDEKRTIYEYLMCTR